MDDLDDVRAFLGYDRINLYGGSYGTRAGARLPAPARRPRARRDPRRRGAARHAAAAVLRARRAARARRCSPDCAADDGCNAAYPEPRRAHARAVRSGSRRSRRRVTVTHPRTGERRGRRVDARAASPTSSSARSTRRSPRRWCRRSIARAEQNDFQGLLALARSATSGEPNMSVGMQLSVICAEDAPRITPDELQQGIGRRRCSART